MKAEFGVAPGLGKAVRRRDFITGIAGSAAAWPLASRAQQAAVPVIGYLHPAFPAPNAHLAVVMRQVLADAGFVEGRNLTIEYRFAEGKYDRLAPLAAELVRRQAALIVAPNTPAALAAKAASATILEHGRTIPLAEVGWPNLL